jgi:hypothetical protein
MIGIYDKGLKDSTFIRNVKTYSNQKVIPCFELEELKDHTVAIAHVYDPDEDWNELVDSYSPPNSVRVRVSTAGIPDPPPPKIRKNVYVFNLMPRSESLESEWQEILSGLSDEATVKSLVRGGNPGRLRHFFEHEVQEILPALAILCEGYLAVHAECKSDKDWTDDDIAPALERMGWTDFMAREGENLSLIKPSLGSQADIELVRGLDWWKGIFEDTASLKQRLEVEWREVTNSPVPNAVSELLKIISQETEIAPPKAVAKAYCAIIEGFGEW